MATLVLAMMQSLDGYVAGIAGELELPPPGPALHRHVNDHLRHSAGALCGRRMYEVMRYWDDDQPDGAEFLTARNS
jgi:dihydrofolate reductase